jgi:NAD(P)-dependent dehydrogenase (short-subunit alcohol dehydrogenase family)
MNGKRLKDRVAVVTGASRGTGAAIALAFAEEGAQLVLAARGAEEMEQVARDIRALGREALVVPTDMMDAQAVLAMIDAAVERFGRLDILVNNAGGAGAYVEGGSAGLLDTSLEAWDALFSLNVRSQFVATQAAARHMKSRHSGVVINVTSVHALFPEHRYHGYSAAKAALHELTRMWAVELGTHGIRVNSIAPGIIVAGLQGRRLLDSDEARLSREALIPLGRLGDPGDVAPAAVYLASDEASYVSGATLMISGGWRGDKAPAPRSSEIRP